MFETNNLEFQELRTFEEEYNFDISEGNNDGSPSETKGGAAGPAGDLEFSKLSSYCQNILDEWPKYDEKARHFSAPHEFPYHKTETALEVSAEDGCCLCSQAFLFQHDEEIPIPESYTMFHAELFPWRNARGSIGLTAMCPEDHDGASLGYGIHYGQ